MCMKIVVKGLPSGRTWNYQRIAEHIKQDVLQVLQKNKDTVEEIITRNRGTLKILLNEEEIRKYAKLGKKELPKFKMQIMRVKKAIQNELGWKVRIYDASNLVIYFDAETLNTLM